MSEDIRRTRKSKMGDGDMRVGSREWGRGGMETEPEKRRERERESGRNRNWDRREGRE